jgi:hypothetical protein
MEHCDAVAVISDLTADARTLDDVAATARLYANAFAMARAVPTRGGATGAAGAKS